MSPKRATSGEAAEPVPGAVWFRERRPAAASRAPALTRERIVAATVALLDARGAQGLSMRKLADALGVHATSLYWHVAHREDLLDLALDAVFGEVTVPDSATDDWRGGLGTYMDELRTALLRHPWSAPLASSRPLLGPRALERAEFVHAALVAGGFTGAGLSAAAAAVTNFVIGTVSAESAWHHEGEAEGRRALIGHLRAAADRHPTLAAHLPAPEADWDDHFARGRDFLLSGLAAPGTGARGARHGG